MPASPPLSPYRSVKLPQGTIRYREAGSGPTLVFVHGFLVNGELWRRIVPLLSARYRCLVPDLPLGGHLPAMPPQTDLSPPGVAQIVAAFLAALDLDDVTLIGSDTGGAISQIVIANHPARITRLVLTNCDAYHNFPPPIVMPFKWAGSVPGFVFAFSYLLRFAPVSGRLLYATVAHHRPGPDVLSQYYGPVITDPGVRRDVKKVLKGASSRHTLAAARAFSSFTKPVLIVWGDDDVIFKKRDAHRLAADFPNARLESVPASRAFISEDQPERLASLIARFVGGPASSGV